jgi:hypothetical protein
MTKQDELLTALEDPNNLELLYDLWRIIKSCPSKAAEILIQFKDVSNATRVATADIQEAIARFDAVKKRIPELEETARRIEGWCKMVKGVDEASVLNRLNRIIDIAGRLGELKALGALDMIETLLKKS